MNTGYENYWVCNREQTVHNLRNNKGLNGVTSHTNYNQIQCERQRSNLMDFTSLQKSLTSQSGLNYFQKSSHYDWRTISNQSSISYNYQNMGACMHQNDRNAYWQNFGQTHSVNMSSVPQSLNYMYHNTYFSKNQNPRAQMARIRVRDVNSLNNIAQNSVQNYDPLDKPLEWHLIRIDDNGERRQNRASKSNVDHRNFPPPVFDVSCFLASRQNPPKPSVYQERCPNVYIKPREKIIPGSVHNMNNMNTRQNEPPCRTSTSYSSKLQDLLESLNQEGISRSAEVPQNVQPVNSRLNIPPNATKDSKLSLPCRVENSYSLGQSAYRSQLPYSDNLEATEVPLVSKGNSLPHNESTSSGIVEENLPSGESSIRVSAVISLSEWCGGSQLNKMPVPTNEKLNVMSGTNTKNTEDHEISNNEVPDIVSNHAPDDTLIVKEEPKMPSEFCRDDTSDISIQNLKVEDFQEQEGGEPQNSVQISDENTLTESVSTEKKNNEDENLNLCKGKISAINQNRENKFTVETGTKNSRREDTSNTREVKLRATEPYYKSQINRDKLDLLIEFINGGDKHSDYVSEQKSKQKKANDSTSAKTNKLSSDKSKSSVKDKLSTMTSKVARIDITRLSPQDLPVTKADDSAKKPKKEEHRKLKEVENLDKASLKNSSKKRNFTDYASPYSRDIQDSHPKRNPKPKSKCMKCKPEKIENESVTTKNQVQISVTKKNSELAEKNKNLKQKKENTDGNIKSEKEEYLLQDSQEEAGNFQSVDIKQEEKPKVNQMAGIVKTQSKVSSYSLSSPQEYDSEKKDQVQKNATGEGKRRSELIFSDIECQLCDFCPTASRAECFWMNIVSGEIKCLHCFKTMNNLEAVETARKLSCDDKNQEVQTKKDNIENVRSPNRKNDTENQTQEKVVNWLNKTLGSDDKKSRRHSTGSKEFRRDKRKSVDEHVLHEKKMKRRKSDEKSSRKEKDQISEALTSRSKTHGGNFKISESSNSDMSNRKSFLKDTSPRKEERHRKNSLDVKKVSSKDVDPTSKLVSKTEKNGEEAKKRVISTEDLRPRKIQIIEEINKDRKDKSPGKSVETPESGKKYEKSKDFWRQIDREKHGYDRESNPKKTTFPWEKDLKENHSPEIQCYEKSPDRRKKYDEKRKSKKEMERSTKDNEGKKKDNIKGGLHYKDFVFKETPVFCYSKQIKDGVFAEILE